MLQVEAEENALQAQLSKSERENLELRLELDVALEQLKSLSDARSAVSVSFRISSPDVEGPEDAADEPSRPRPIRCKTMTMTSQADEQQDNDDDEYGLGDEQLKETQRKFTNKGWGYTRARSITESTHIHDTDARESDFGISSAQLRQLHAMDAARSEGSESEESSSDEDEVQELCSTEHTARAQTTNSAAFQSTALDETQYMCSTDSEGPVISAFGEFNARPVRSGEAFRTSWGDKTTAVNRGLQTGRCSFMTAVSDEDDEESDFDQHDFDEKTVEIGIAGSSSRVLHVVDLLRAHGSWRSLQEPAVLFEDVVVALELDGLIQSMPERSYSSTSKGCGSLPALDLNELRKLPSEASMDIPEDFWQRFDTLESAIDSVVSEQSALQDCQPKLGGGVPTMSEYFCLQLPTGQPREDIRALTVHVARVSATSLRIVFTTMAGADIVSFDIGEDCNFGELEAQLLCELDKSLTSRRLHSRFRLFAQGVDISRLKATFSVSKLSTLSESTISMHEDLERIRPQGDDLYVAMEFEALLEDFTDTLTDGTHVEDVASVLRHWTQSSGGAAHRPSKSFEHAATSLSSVIQALCSVDAGNSLPAEHNIETQLEPMRLPSLHIADNLPEKLWQDLDVLEADVNRLFEQRCVLETRQMVAELSLPSAENAFLEDEGEAV